MVPYFQENTFARKAQQPLMDLQRALDIGSFWQANLRLLQCVMPHHSCSLMLGVVDDSPSEALHHVVADRREDYLPASSLSISTPFLRSHPQIKLYTYSDVMSADPTASVRRIVQEPQPGDWNEFMHLAFWDGGEPDAVLSIRRSVSHGAFTADEKDFLARLHPLIETGLHRLRAVRRERLRSASMERFIAGLPLPVMFLDASGKPVFASKEAYDMCAAWNFGFKEARRLNTRRCFRVPSEIAAACLELDAALRQLPSDEEMPVLNRKRVAHPTIPGFAARIDVTLPCRGPWAHPGSFVTFTCERNFDGAAAERRSEALAILQRLSPSERRVALLVAEGCRNQEVAAKLGKSIRTVEFQLSTIYRKLSVASRTELVRLIA